MKLTPCYNYDFYTDIGWWFGIQFYFDPGEWNPCPCCDNPAVTRSLAFYLPFVCLVITWDVSEDLGVKYDL